MMKLLMRSLAALFLLAAPAMAQTTANGPWQAALGSPNDAGCAYTSGKASIPCLLSVMVRQAAPTSVVGTSIAAGVQVPGFQGVTNGVPVSVVMATTSAFNLTQIGSVALTLGQKVSAQSIPVVLASDGTQATAANQNVTQAGTSASNAQGVQGVTNGVPMPVTGTLTTKAGVALASPAYRIPASVAGSNAQVFATGAKQMLHAYFCNKATTDRAVKFFDKATNPIPGTDAIVTSILAPAGTCAAIDFSGGGFPFLNGLAVAVTGAGGDSDTGSSVAAGDIVGLNIQHN